MHPASAVVILAVSAAAGFLRGRAAPSPQFPVDSLENREPAALSGSGPAVVKAAPAPGTPETWTQRLRAAAAGELPALAEEIAAIPDERLRRRAQRLLCARWAEAAPAEGLAFFTEQAKTRPEMLYTSGLRAWLLTEWALLDLDAAWAAVESDADLKNEKSFVGQQLLREDREVFWQWFVRAREPLPDSGGGSAEIWRELARSHFDEMLALAPEVGKEAGPQYPWLYGPLAEVMAERDAGQALAWVKTLPEALRNPLFTRTLTILAKRDPLAAAAHWEELRNTQAEGVRFQNGGGGEVLKTILTALHETAGPLEMLKFAGAKSGGGTETQQIGTLLAQSIQSGALSFQEAFKAVQATESDGERIRLNVMRKMWRGLSGEKLAEAAGWLSMQMQEGKAWSDIAPTGAVQQWQAQDSAAALAFATGIPDEKVRREVWDGLMKGSLMMQRPEEAQALLSALPAEDRAAAVAAGLESSFSSDRLSHDASLASRFDPAVFEEALRNAPPSPQRTEAVNRLGQAWGALDPAAASAWALQQPDPAARREALSGVADGWAQHDAYAFSEWTEQLPAGPERDVAAHRLARAIREQEPDSAWAWASQITDAAERQEARLAVLRKWRDSAPEAARAAIEDVRGQPGGDPVPLLDTLEKRDNPSAAAK